MPRRAASRTPQPQAPAAQVLTSAVHSHVAVVAARLTGSDALIERRLRPLRVAQRKRVEMTRGASSDVAMPRVGRVCCRLDPARFAPPSGSPLHGNFRLAGPQDRRLRGNSAHVAGPGSDAQGRPSCPPRSKGLFGSRDPRWPPPPLGFPFPHRPDQGQAGQWSHHSTTVDKNKWPLALAWRFSGLSTSHFTPQGRPGGDCSGFVYLSAYLHFGCPHQPIPSLGLMQSQPLTF